MTPQSTGNPPAAFLITGISASGKSTAAQALAEQLPRSVHLRGDAFRRMIVSDRADMRPDGQQHALDQLRLRHKLTAHALDTYATAGFTVVAQDVVLGPLLPEMIAEITTRPLAVVVLAPPPHVVRVRETARSKTGYADWTPEELDRGLREGTTETGLWLDNSNQDVDGTVAEILRRSPREGVVE